MRGLVHVAVAAMMLAGLIPAAAHAHFVVLLPSRDVVSAADEKAVQLDIAFTHPMQQGPVMEMDRPRQFGVLRRGIKQDLGKTLKPRELDGKTAYTAAIPIGEPGDYVFYIEPTPYWEPAEKKLIVQYAKVVVDGLGAEEGWDALVGLPVEIEPLVRPYGLWTGNVFRGVVRREGKPVAFATVEVEYYNRGKRVKTPNDAFITQVIKTDANGVFCYSMPRAGWWGFAAVIQSDQKLPGPDGKPAAVELGGVMWVKAADMEVRDGTR